MKKFTLFLVALMAFLPFAAFSQLSVAWEYNFKSKDWTPITTYQFATVNDVPILKRIDVSGIAGVQGGSGKATAGFLLSRSFEVGKGFDFLVGITGRWTASRPPQFGGVVIGGVWRF